jgi:hypothetical protein
LQGEGWGGGRNFPFQLFCLHTDFFLAALFPSAKREEWIWFKWMIQIHAESGDGRSFFRILDFLLFFRGIFLHHLIYSLGIIKYFALGGGDLRSGWFFAGGEQQRDGEQDVSHVSSG